VLRSVLAASACLLLFAGCGGSHHRATPPATKAGFAASANAVCRDVQSHRARIAGLRRLRPPEDERDLFGHWLAAERLAVEAGDVIAGRAKAEDVDARVELAVAEGKIAGYARRLGAVACVPPQA
jgi:hypothetical protein